MADTQNFLEEKIEEVITLPKNHWRYFLAGAVLIVVLGVLLGAPFVYVAQFTDSEGVARVLPGVYVGEHHVGGLTQDELQSFLESKDTQLAEEGFTFLFEDDQGTHRKFVTLPLVYTQVLGQSFSFASIDVEDTIDRALEYGRHGNAMRNAVDAVRLRFVPKHIRASTIVLEEEFEDVLDVNLGQYQTPMRNAGIVFSTSTPDMPTMVLEQVGEEFDYGAAIMVAKDQLEQLVMAPIEVPRVVVRPQITARDAREVLDQYAQAKLQFPSTIQYIPQKDSIFIRKELSWDISEEDVKQWIGFQKLEDNTVRFGVESEKFTAYLEPIASTVEVLPQEAKFSVSADGSRAQQFQPSRNGVAVDYDSVIEFMNQRLAIATIGEGVAEVAVPLAHEVSEPHIKTADVNSLGIQELLGTGISRFVGSSSDRISNIKNASTKLNGVLIAPGDVFSLVSLIRPITRENGYVPELIIKGDKIEKGVGGGLCQIGTTSFRMAMNSGMEVVERHNHSLVVSYYNDLTNGNPGTDATIYDPVLDFKFKNDTPNHVLMTTEVDVPNRELRYFLWGTSDGRKGYYTPPVVHKWIGAGPEKEIKTTDQAPGTRECQHAYQGAVTSFTYTVEQADGTLDETVYESRYRPLPKICFVGITEEDQAEEQAKKLLDQELIDLLDPPSAYQSSDDSAESDNESDD